MISYPILSSANVLPRLSSVDVSLYRIPISYPYIISSIISLYLLSLFLYHSHD